jgi:filamentous hemagglutinin family protein
MNRIYKTLWSVSTQSWQAVPETAKASGKKCSSSAVGVVASVALSLSLSGGANAQSPPAINQLPTGGSVARGTATISQTATAQAAAMTVNQSSQRAVINWNTFNLGQSASINFVQPNAQAVTLNRVNDSNPSQIFGRMTANGQVFLTNANGVYFSPTSSVDVGALTATTHSITDDNFMSGNYVFERSGATGKVINEGNITAALGGYVALLAPEVQNAGVVVARAGTVALAAGEMITLTIDGAGSLAGITTTPSTIATLVENKHAVLAPDGQIILSAVALDKLQAGVIKNSGSLEANSISNKGGKIYLEGDDITLTATSKIEAKGATGGGTVLVGGDWQGSGDLRQATKVTMEAGATIDASVTDKGDGGKVVLWSDVHNADSATRVNGSIKAEAGPNGGDGGKVETSGHRLNVDSIQVSTQSTKGKTGEWLLDPLDFTIAASGGDMTGTALGNLLASNNISIYAGTTAANTATSYYGSVAGAGANIKINDNISWSTNKTLTLTATGGVIGSGGIEMTGLGTVIFNHTTAGITTNYSGIVSGNGNVTKQGSGVLTFGVDQTYTGNTTITSGSIEFDGAIASSAISLNGVGVTFYTSNSGSRTVASNISGSGAVYLTGYRSTFTLTGNNNYSGGTNLSYTSVVLGSGNALGSTGSISLQGQIGLTYTAQNTVDYSGRINLSANSVLTVDTGGQNVTWAGTPFSSSLTGSALIKNGAGTLVLNNGARLTGNTSYTPSTPPITVKAGTLVLAGANNLGTGWSSGAGIVIDAGATLQVGNGGSTGDLGGGPTAVMNNGTLTFNRSDTGGLIVNNSISGTGNVIMAGTGDVALQSSGNTFSGGTRLVAGSLIPDVDMTTATSPSLGTTGSITFEGGTLKYTSTNDMTDYSSRFSRIDGKGYRFDIGSSDGPVWATALTDSGISTTSATLTKLGSGPLYLTGNNTYTGTTTVSAGKLYLGNDTTTGSVAGNIVLASASTFLYVKRNGSFELSNNITGSTASIAGNLVVNMTNPNDVVTLSGSNVFNYVQLSSGALGLGSSHAIDRATASRDIYFSGGRLQYSSFDTSDYSDRFAIHPSTPSAPFAIDTNGQTVTFAPNALAPLSNTLTTNSLEKYGTGTLILNFISGKGYSGATTVRAGTLQVGNGATGGTWRTSGAFVAADASLIFKPSSSGSIISTSVSQDPTTSTSGSVSFVQTGSTDIMTYSGNISNAISLFQLGSSTGTGGTLLLTGTNSSPSTGATTISLGTLKLGSADATGVLNTGVITNNGTLIYNRNDAKTISAKISGTGALIDQGSGTLTLSGANDYTGATTVSAGTLVITNATGLGTAAAGTTVASGATLDLQGVAVGSEAITLNGGTLATSTGTSSLIGTVTMGANSTVNVSGTALTLNGVVSGAYALTKSGSGALTLAAANSYTGATTVNAGTLVVTNATGLGTTGVGAGTTVANGSTLDLQGVVVGNEAITLNGGSTLSTSTGTSSLSGAVAMGAASTVNVGGTSLTLSGVVSGAYALTKSGSGTLVLAANNTYSSTVFSAGTLRLANNGALPDSSLTVAAGNTLELGSINNSNLNVSGKTITLASSGTYGGGGYLHNVAGDNIWSGAITLQNNTTVTVDTNTSLNLSSATSTVDSAATVFLKPSNGNLTFGTLTGSGGASYVSSGSGTLSGNFVGLGAKTLVYARPLDANNLNSSYYGSTPGLTLGFFSASTGGTQYSLVSGTDYTGTIVYSGAPTATSVPGSYTISYSSGASISNASYYLAGAGTGLTWTVNAKPLTITVGSTSKTYDGQVFSGGSVTYSAFANGQSASALTGSLTYGGTAQGAVNAASSPYTITASGLTSTNYLITFVDGSLTINKANLSKVTAAKTYDGLSTVTAAQMTAIEGVNGETFTASAGTASISDKNVTTANKTLTDLSNLTLVGSSNTVLASNYNLGTGLPAAGSANQVDISALALQVTGISALSKTFDGSNAVNLSGTAQVASLAGDAVTLDASGMTAQFGSTAVGRAIPVTVTGYALAGGSAGNYSLIQPTGLSADINSAAAPIQPPVVPPIVLPPAPVTPPSVPPGTSPISKDVTPPAPEAPAVPPVAEAPPASPVAEAGTNEPQTTNERTNNKNANSAVLAAAASVAQAVTARPQTVGIPTGAPAGSQASIQVLLVKPASVQTEGLVNVRVSADLVSSANNLVIPLADHLDWRQLQANDAVSVRLANGMSLPDWVQYEAPQKALVAKAIPLNALPLQVMVQIGDRRYLVDIREADLNKVGMQ